VDPEIRFQGKGFDFTVPLGEGQVRPNEGGARIEGVPRPGRSSLTQFEGVDLVKLEIPAFWDGWPRRSIQDHVDQVASLAFAKKGDLPVFKCTGPMPFSGWRFQMDGLPEWLDDPEPQRSPGGALVRQAMLIHVVEFNNPDPIDIDRDVPSHEGGLAVGHARSLGGVGPGVPLTIKLSSSLTCQQIAVQVLHDINRAKDIAELNGIRDIRLKLPAGRTIKLPPEEV
jgi:hypothetical protein